MRRETWDGNPSDLSSGLFLRLGRSSQSQPGRLPQNLRATRSRQRRQRFTGRIFGRCTKGWGQAAPDLLSVGRCRVPPEFPSERSLATIPPTMKALMAALHSFQLASLQRRSGRYVEVGERAIIRSSTYILEGRARLNIFKDPPFSILKLRHFWPSCLFRNRDHSKTPGSSCYLEFDMIFAGRGIRSNQR